ncbi:HlyD family secretion protein [Bradyrhizobium sp. NP1]|uniref:efflux RND transporter periplasmic adaptor subunit n=1 Tax=Bradyrhizobium sp. NP1 TaxID=3049772 RepID=UPI0025A52D05|nr:HlyD family secretion protein [Bradyrhizobium sp. NP1]WJR79958.1 HlyD family secretion protein [Bradyrhizobium sp. NP1]
MPALSSMLRVLVTLAVIAIAAVAGWYLWRTYEESPWTRDGRVRANVVNVAPDVAGAVVDIRVKDNQEVRIGDVLFVIDPARYQLAVSQAEAAQAGAKSVLDQREEEFARREKLSSISISDEALAQARAAALGAQASYDQATAELGTARLNLARTEVRSPVNGHVTNLLLDRGDYATAGRALVAIVDSDSYYVAGYFEETKLRNIRVGDPASIRLMGYPRPLTGHVQSVARAITDRENALGNDLIANVNPTFSWVRLAQRIPVRIAIDDVPDGITLSAGMTATIVVTQGDDRRRVKPPAP